MFGKSLSSGGGALLFRRWGGVLVLSGDLGSLPVAVGVTAKFIRTIPPGSNCTKRDLLLPSLKRILGARRYSGILVRSRIPVCIPGRILAMENKPSGSVMMRLPVF